ncbi:MAG TPA: GNAT family N-acetyltransferase [Gemmatimonadales bacterium]|nr:GNAT family N-acetyltransferase [Gemmatimonadales bacterium]
MEIQHDTAERRFVIQLPGGAAVLAYEAAGPGLVDFYSTYVPPPERGRGVAAKLVRAGVTFARAEGLRIVPSCWYVRRWLEAHPEEHDLVAP